MTRCNKVKGAKLNLCYAALAVAVATSLTSATASAQALETKAAFSIPAGDLASAVDAFSRQSGLQVLYKPDVLEGKKATPVSGLLANGAALERLLEGTGVTWKRVNERTYVLKSGKKAAHKNSGTEERGGGSTGENPKAATELQKLVVVGSRLGTSPVESAMPIRVISREDIERYGSTSIAQVLNYLPEVSVSNGPNGSVGVTDDGSARDINASSVQLRGLPLGTTLILIDGRRAGESSALASSGLFDLSTVPLAMVERIEVLPAGSSAIYGGDGLAGVINIVTRKNAEAAELRFGSLSLDGYSEEQVSALWGKTWGRGSVSAMVSWKKNGNLSTSERSLTANTDYTRFGGRDRRSHVYPPFANVYSIDGCPPGFCLVPLDQRGNLPGTNSPYATVRAGQNGLNLSPADFNSGVQSYGDIEGKWRTKERSVSASLSAKFQASESLELFADVFTNDRDIPARELQLQIILGEYGWEESIVSAGNPFNPFGVDVAATYYFPDTNIFTSYTQKYMRFNVGARGEWGKFQWEIAGLRAKDRTDFEGPSGFNSALVAQALRSSDSQTALNIFAGDGSSPGSQQLLESLTFPYNTDQESNLNGVSGYIRGPVVTLPAGDMHALVGAEYQKTSLKSAYRGTTRTEGDDTTRAFFAEVRAPLIRSDNESGQREKLAATSAYRRENIGRTEKSANTGTIGVEYRPSNSVLLRGTYSEAFKPIIAYSSYLAVDPSTVPFIVSDPQFGGRDFSIYPILGGGVPPGLRPETSSNVTFGVVWSPSDKVRASVSFWQSDITDKFLTLDGTREDHEYIINNELQYPGRVIRNPTTGFIEQVDMRVINVSSTRLNGADLSFDGRIDTRFGEIVSSLGATYTHKYEEIRFPGAISQNRVAVIGTTGWAPRWKIVPRVIWYPSESVSASIAGRVVSDYRDTIPLDSGPNAGKLITLGNTWIMDVSVGMDMKRWLPPQAAWVDGARLRANFNNIGNRLPDFCNGCGGGFDATQSDIMGRSFSTELVLNF